MPSKARTATVLAVAAATLMLASGCAEDRSNLLPRATAEQLELKLDEVRSLHREGNCFEALAAAEEVRTEVEGLGGDVDGTLQRTLVDGVTQLQVTVQDNCVEADTEPTVEVAPEPAPEETQTTEPEPESGATGTTGNGGDTGTTGGGGDTGTTGGGGGGQPEPEPTPPPDNGSGGVGPSTGGAAP